MSEQSAVKVVRAFFDVLSAGDLGAISRFTAPDVIYVIYGEDSCANDAVPWAGRHHGHGALRTAFETIYSELRVERFTVDLMFGEGEFVAIFGQYQATSISTGRSFRTPFAQRARVVNGAIVECVMSEDSRAVAAAIRIV